MHRKREGMLLAIAGMALLVGCGSDGDGDGAKFPDYVGTWHYDQSTGVIDCGGANTFNGSPIGNKVFQDGLTRGIVDVTPSPVDNQSACNFGFDVKDTTATMFTGQTCTLAAIDAAATMTPTQWRFTLLSPTTAEEIGNADMAGLPDPSGGPTPVTCTFTLSARLTRVAAD